MDHQIVGSRVTVKKRKAGRRVAQVRAVGVYEAWDEDRVTGEVTYLGRVENTISAAGLDRWMNVIAGVSTTDLDSTAILVVDPGGASEKTYSGCDTIAGGYEADYPLTTTTKEYKWRWSDSTADTPNGGSVQVKFSDGVLWSSNGATGFGTKSFEKIRRITYTLTISSLDTELNYAGYNGLHGFLEILAGDGPALDAITTDGHLYTSGGTLWDTVNCSAGPTVDTVADTISWSFEFGDGVGNIDWDTAEFAMRGTYDVRRGGTGTAGIKGSGDVWTPTVVLSF